MASKIADCWSSGRPSPLSHARTTECAIPILAARWPGVRFLSSRLTLSQSPSVFAFVFNVLSVDLSLIRPAITALRFRCAIPSRDTLPRERTLTSAEISRRHGRRGFGGLSTYRSNIHGPGSLVGVILRYTWASVFVIGRRKNMRADKMRRWTAPVCLRFFRSIF